jgi:hypothetical protein
VLGPPRPDRRRCPPLGSIPNSPPSRSGLMRRRARAHNRGGSGGLEMQACSTMQLEVEIGEMGIRVGEVATRHFYMWVV